MSAVPPWLRPYYQASDDKLFLSLIEKVETQTQAELIPLIVRSSVDRPLIQIIFILMGLIISLAVSPLFNEWLPWVPFLSLTGLHIFCSLVLVSLFLWLSQRQWVLEKFLSKSFLDHCVYRRACFEFFENKLHLTESRSAVLFMYSVLERKAMIIADPHLQNIPAGLWEAAIQKMIEGAKKNSFYEGFSKALELTATELAAAYPAKDINKNELPDQIIFKD